MSSWVIPSPGWERARVRVMKKSNSFVGGPCSCRLDASLRWHDESLGSNIPPYDTEAFDITIGALLLTLLRVKDLERWVDREALLRDEAEEPPYWAHVWTGALTLARYLETHVDCRDDDCA